MKKHIVIYHEYIPKVGGIESAVYNLAKSLRLEEYRVTIAYKSAETGLSVLKYASVADVYRIDPQADETIQCDVALIASNHHIPSQISARRYLQWIHSDYSKYQLSIKNKGKVEYVAVSHHAAQIIKKLEDVDAEVIHNLVDPDLGKKNTNPLRLVTVSRVSPEKGFDRMFEFASKLEKAGVDYLWTVVGDNTSSPTYFKSYVDKFSRFEGVSFVGYKSNPEQYIKDADFLVQLSDFEGCPLSVLESLTLNTPVVVTNWGGADEIVQDGRNGFIVRMTLTDVDIRLFERMQKMKGIKHSYKVGLAKLTSVHKWIDIIESE